MLHSLLGVLFLATYPAGGDDSVAQKLTDRYLKDFDELTVRLR